MNVNRRLVCLFQTASLSGSSANSVAFVVIQWLILDISDSATSSGLIVGLSSLLLILIASLAGIFIGWWGSRLVSAIPGGFGMKPSVVAAPGIAGAHGGHAEVRHSRKGLPRRCRKETRECGGKTNHPVPA